ncbi:MULTISPECIES: WxL domain-containing protein [Enterococcus]|uniref:WxL domain-containing protein n=1 Tax=Enterococcus TaxID=1350 RepID=UPI00046C89AA|nr:WxL domain-containing protein [Enterococcus faecalis]EGO2598511.1 WxL domain-containing protein [Enterococcus faecalis]EGO2740994.1 WxL domain-containing protein [Enterococcus faecalis]EGO7697024.1 WxL domain-containing protein [Enterococcus faecalis]EGO8007861.1 WxL domain-containing protein [Enterococcus faecalis]
MVNSTDFQAVFYQKTVVPPWYKRNHWKYQVVVSKFKISAGTFFDKMKIIQKIIHRTIKITIKSYIKKENGMNQKRNRLFAIALCGSLLISSLNGIPAIAETITAPNITQEKPQEEPQADAPPESSESGAALRGLPVIPPITTTVAEAQPEEPPVTEVSENFQLDQPVPLMPDLQQGSKRENRAAGTFAIPAKTYKLAFIDEAGNYIDPAKVTITGEAMKVEAQGTSGKVGDVVTSNVGNLKEMTVPTVTLADDDSTGNTGYSGVRNSQIRLPGYYDLPQMSPTTYYTGTTFPIAQSKRVRLTNNEVTETDESGTRFRLLRTTPKQYAFTTVSWQSDVSKTKFAYGFSMATTSGANDYYTTDDTVYYYVPNRRVSIYYSTMEPGALPAYPTGYNASLSKTVVDSDAFHYKAPKAFPATYSSGNRYFRFKGWYKGAVRPADPKAVKLETSLTPEFDVTYDGADNLYVFYDEVKEMTTTIPEVTYKFGFVDEKGALVAPTNVDIQANLTTVEDNVVQKVGTVTGANAGNLKQLTVPSQTLTYVPKIKVSTSGVTDFRLTIPKRYQIPTVTPGSFYTGSTTAYPLATTLLRYISGQADERITTDGTRYSLYNLPTPHSYRMYRSNWLPDVTKTVYSAALSMASTEAQPTYFTTDNTMYYFLENRRVTEHYVDEAGAEVLMPTGFTQGNQTVIDSDTYHFKLAKELPFSYFLNNKAYRFKGWYKGKTKPKVLETSRTPEYDTTFDDNDDLTVVYEEIKYGGNTVTFGFVGEDGQLLQPTGFQVTTDIVETIDGLSTVLSNVSAVDSTGNVKTLTIPQKEYVLTPQMNFYGTKNSLITIPRQYQEISFTKPANYQGLDYPVAGRVENMFSGNPYDAGAQPPYFSASKVKANQYKIIEFHWKEEPTQSFSSLYKATLIRSSVAPTGVEMYPNKPIYYYATNRRVTENFVDKSGAKITPPQGFTQGNQVTVTSDPFTYTASKALPSVYAAGAKTYKFVGWYKGTAKPTTLKTTATPTYQVDFDDNDDMTAVYEEETPTAALTLTSTNRVVNNGDSVDWVATLKNTSLAPLKTLTVKPATTWPVGIGTPTSLSVQLDGQAPKIYPVTATTWSEGISLTGLEIPAGQTANVTLVGTKISGTSDQRLTATLDVTGNFATVSAADAVRLTDTTQGTITPTAEGFISVPTFDFGQMNIASKTQQSGLKKAADYYENGTRNPYLRIKKNQPNWQMTAQLSQPKATTDSLPTATRLLLGPANVSSFTNYNEATEQIKAVGKTSSLSLTANNVATSVVANQQFTGSDVYQLDFTFENIKLEVPANQGTKGQQYNAAVTWNLVTGP